MNVIREDLAWAGGLFEGEGYFSHWKASPGGAIGIEAGLGMTDADSVRRFRDIIGFGYIVESRKGASYHKTLYRWNCGKWEYVQAVGALLWPWLGERRKARFREMMSAYKAGSHRRLGSGLRCAKGHIVAADRPCRVCQPEDHRRDC